MSKPIALIINDLVERDLVDLGRRVAVKHACLLEEALGPRHTHSFAAARHELWAILQATGLWSYMRLASTFDRNHTTIIAGVKQHYLRQMKGAA